MRAILANHTAQPKRKAVNAEERGSVERRIDLPE
jgi:hypothetical protein